MSYRNQKDADQARLNSLEEEIAQLKKENEELKKPKAKKPKNQNPPPPDHGIPWSAQDELPKPWPKIVNIENKVERLAGIQPFAWLGVTTIIIIGYMILKSLSLIIH